MDRWLSLQLQSYCGGQDISLLPGLPAVRRSASAFSHFVSSLCCLEQEEAEAGARPPRAMGGLLVGLKYCSETRRAEEAHHTEAKGQDSGSASAQQSVTAGMPEKLY